MRQHGSGADILAEISCVQFEIGEKRMKIGFIGLGNMATAMIGGMLGTGTFQAEEIIGSAKHRRPRIGSVRSMAFPLARTTKIRRFFRMC